MMGSRFPYQFELSAPIPDRLPVAALRGYIIDDLASVPGVDVKCFDGQIAFRTRSVPRKWREEWRWPIVRAGVIRFSEQNHRVTMTVSAREELLLALLGFVVFTTMAIISGNSVLPVVALAAVWLGLIVIYMPRAGQRFLNSMVARPEP